MGINRLRAHPDFDIQALAVISEDSMIPICEKYGVDWVMHKNQPLGEKKNYGLMYAKKFDFDYLMEIGSDDLILNELLTDYIKYIGKHDFFGITDSAYINSESGECRRLISRHSTYGAGRMIHRKVLEKVNWKLWHDHLMRGLDNNSVFTLQKAGVKYHKADVLDFPCVVDVKSKENIWKFNYFLGKPYEIGDILKRLSPDEVELLNSLIESHVAVEN